MRELYLSSQLLVLNQYLHGRDVVRHGSGQSKQDWLRVIRIYKEVLGCIGYFG
jgi:hypothetical protein